MTLRSLRQEHWVVFGLAFLGFVGALIIAYGTRWGPWAFSDSVGYLVNARNLATGKGLGLYRPSGQFVPLVMHPPLYPLLLIALAGPGLDLVGAAKWIDILAFGILVFISGWLFYRLTRSVWGSMALSGLMLVHPALVNAYTSAMAEPIFLLTEVAGALLLLLYLETGARSHLVLGAVTSGMALLTRYPGAVFVATGAVCLVLFGRGAIMRRLKRLVGYTSLAILPVAVFVLWSNIRYAGAIPRGVKTSFDLIPQLIVFIGRVPSIVYSWKPVTAEIIGLTDAGSDFLRGAAKPASAIAGLAFVVFLVFSTGRVLSQIRTGELKASVLRIPALFLILQVGYLAFFGIAFVVTSPTPDINGRTILPILPALIFTVVSLGFVLVRAWPGAIWLRIVAGVCALGSIAGYAAISAGPLDRLHQNGLGYTSPEWRRSETIRAAMELPTDIPLISNEPIAVLFYLDRWPHELSVGGEPGLPSTFTRYGDGADEMESIFRDQHAALILFDTIYAQIAGTYQDEAQARVEALTAGLTLEFRGDDGAIYFYPEPQAISRVP